MKNRNRRSTRTMKEKLRAELLGGALQDHKLFLNGIYKGYYMLIEPMNGQYRIKINTYSQDDEKNQQLNAWLLQKKETVREILAVTAGEHYIVINLKIPNLAKNIPGAVNAVVDPVMDYLRSHYYVSGCESCGSAEKTIECYEINGGHHYLCPDCADGIDVALAENQRDVRSQKSNLLTGLVGAFIGSLLGGALWILIYKLGYIAGVAGLVTGVCALKGYEMLGGHVDRKGVVGCVVIMLITIFFANKISWTWEAYDALQSSGWTFTECFQYLGYILEESDLTGSYYGDLIIGYILTGVSSFRNIVDAFRASGGDYKMRKV